MKAAHAENSTCPNPTTHPNPASAAMAPDPNRPTVDRCNLMPLIMPVMIRTRQCRRKGLRDETPRFRLSSLSPFLHASTMELLTDVISNALLITGFVSIMMLVIEYLNVLTQGNWDRLISRLAWGQPLFCAFLGVTPGCLGAFAVTSLYMHRVVTFGALVATMVATCGDEAFVMLAMFPRQALVLFGILLVTGTVSGIVTDLILKARRTAALPKLDVYAPAHAVPDCIPFSSRDVFNHWRRCTPHRGWLALLLALFVFGVLSGVVGHHHDALGIPSTGAAMTDYHHEHDEAVEDHETGPYDHAGESDWGWVRVTLLLLGLVGLAIVITVPDHFLDEHLWKHLVRVHLGRIFLWTLGALIVTRVLAQVIDIEAAVQSHRLPVLLIACLVGLIPQSGPHLIFVTLYADGAIPFSILVASSIVQDGHGMIPLLAHSRRAFVAVKAINLAIGLAVGLSGALLGW